MAFPGYLANTVLTGGCVKEGVIKKSAWEENKQNLEALGNQVCFPSQTLKYLPEDKWKKYIKNNS